MFLNLRSNPCESDPIQMCVFGANVHTQVVPFTDAQWDQWFASYTEFFTHYATLAQVCACNFVSLSTRPTLYAVCFCKSITAPYVCVCNGACSIRLRAGVEGGDDVNELRVVLSKSTRIAVAKTRRPNQTNLQWPVDRVADCWT